MWGLKVDGHGQAGSVAVRSSYRAPGASPTRTGRRSMQARPAPDNQDGPLDDILGHVTELLSQVNNILGSN
jgi:hypothetical protein